MRCRRTAELACKSSARVAVVSSKPPSSKSCFISAPRARCRMHRRRRSLPRRRRIAPRLASPLGISARAVCRVTDAAICITVSSPCRVTSLYYECIIYRRVQLFRCKLRRSQVGGVASDGIFYFSRYGNKRNSASRVKNFTASIKFPSLEGFIQIFAGYVAFLKNLVRRRVVESRDTFIYT